MSSIMPAPYPVWITEVSGRVLPACVGMRGAPPGAQVPGRENQCEKLHYAVPLSSSGGDPPDGLDPGAEPGRDDDGVEPGPDQGHPQPQPTRPRRITPQPALAPAPAPGPVNPIPRHRNTDDRPAGELTPCGRGGLSAVCGREPRWPDAGREKCRLWHVAW